MNKFLKFILLIMLVFGFCGLSGSIAQAIVSDDKNLTQSAEVAKEVDFGPYMREMQRKIKLNWNPVKSETSSSVVLKYQIKKDGSLGEYSVLKSSGDKKVDNSAIKALKKSFPFRPLPKAFAGDKIDVQFTFNYNVFKK